MTLEECFAGEANVNVRSYELVMEPQQLASTDMQGLNISNEMKD
jgi:hypothetical protein